MLLYRCYLFDNFDRIRDFVEIRARSDPEAAAHARRHVGSGGKAFELWRGKNFICREPPP
jgi:hypothetical protein